VKRILEGVSNDAWRVWSGCLDASKMLRDKYVFERNLDGSSKQEEPITAKMREDAFAQITTKIHDPTYGEAVKASLVWQLMIIWKPGYFTHGLSYRIVGLNKEVTVYGVVCLMLKN
jgi:hypothetical protein